MTFDRVYVIHLPHAERRAGMEAELARMGLTATFVHAKPPERGFTMTNMRRNPAAEFGCALSHVKALVRALSDGAQRPLFLEDDVRFRCGPEQLQEVIAELPADWDMCYFGGHPRSPVQRVSPSLVRVGTFSFAEAYTIRGAMLGSALEFWLDCIGQPDAMYDLVLGSFAAAHNGYCAHPLLTEQPPGWSAIGNKMDDKRRLVERGWQNNLR